MFPFQSERFKDASRGVLPFCTTFQYIKAHRQPTNGSIKSANTNTDGSIHTNHLRAGNLVSADQFGSRLKGRTYSSLCGLNADKFMGGFIFVESMSTFIHLEHQLWFSGSETIRTKQNFEKLALYHGVLVDSYKTDNIVFK